MGGRFSPPPFNIVKRACYHFFRHFFEGGVEVYNIRKVGGLMPRKYDNNFKSMIVNLIVNEKHSTIRTAEQFEIPLKTLEKWITAYNKDNKVFDKDYLTSAKQIELLKKKVSRLERDNEILKKTIILLAKKE